MTTLAKLTDGVVHEPLKIVTAGGSVSLFVTPPRARRDEGNYGELLPRMLAGHGVTATVSHQGKWFDHIAELRRRFEPAVRNQFPDVLVLNYGMVECQPHVLPTWAARHFASWDRSSHPAALWYRERVAPPVWRRLRTFQQSGASRVGLHTWRLSPDRFRFEMRRVIEMTREDTGALVLLLDCDPPGSRFEHWVPGMGKRWELYQQILADLVEDLADDEVRLVPNSRTILDELGFEEGLPDGIHRSAIGHRRTAELLLDEILDWLRQPATGRRAGPTLADRAVEGLHAVREVR